MVLGPLTKPEYEALKAMLAEIEKAEAQLGQPFRNHPVEGVRRRHARGSARRS